MALEFPLAHRVNRSTDPAVRVPGASAYETACPPPSANRDNARTCLCALAVEARGRRAAAALEAGMVPTADASDAAHFVRQPTDAGRTQWLLLAAPEAAARGVRVTPRRYPPAVMVGRRGHRVGPDSAFDATASLAARLAADGVELGVRVRMGPSAAQEAARVWADRLGGARKLRAVLHPREVLHPEDAVAERVTRAFLRAKGVEG